VLSDPTFADRLDTFRPVPAFKATGAVVDDKLNTKVPPGRLLKKSLVTGMAM